ncbi:putative lipid II flippase FtsW [Marispirochaeta sp.]|jgi:cell division protein FtsW|uniref:putative lipid II flippase FtsW n=1 Tax=Marispirochaeta sp. TaxID=2038653 RepID=UPI0029C7B5B7|nr:putative lipid II flippase FtsW [Marispirochaeta sp.]
MRNIFVAEKVDTRPADLVFLGVMVLLAGLGAAFLFSSSYYYGEQKFGDSYHFLIKRGVFLLAGSVGFLIASRLSLAVLRKMVAPFLLFSGISLLLPFVPGIGGELMGAKRWVFLFGNSFQPSELAKLALVVYLAHFFSKKKDRLDDLVNTVLPPLIITALFAFIIYSQNDFSTAFFLISVSAAMFFVSGVKLSYFFFLITAIVPLGAMLIFTKEHRVQRIIAFLQPELDPVGTGYQVIAARDALEKGGFMGVGLGQGTEKIGGLPEAHSDFVFAVLAEEAGLLGVLAIITVFIIFAVRGYGIALKSGDSFSFLLGFGCVTAIFLQALFNLAVVAGLVPATGIPLPFFSSGGSSLMITLVMCGLLYNISRTDSKQGGFW